MGRVRILDANPITDLGEDSVYKHGDFGTSKRSYMPTKSRRTDASRLIARIWRGRVPTEKADDYEKYLEATGFKDYDTTDGNMGLVALRRTDPSSGTTEFLLVSLWKSLASIKEFTGSDVEKAVYYPRDKEFLVELEPNVSHYDIVTLTSKSAGPQSKKKGAKSRKKKSHRR